MLKYLFLIITLSLSTTYTYSQPKSTLLENAKGFLIDITYGTHLTGGDLQERFGTGFSIGVGTQYMTSSKWIFGLQSAVYFGGTLREDVVATLRTENGEIIGQNNTYAAVSLNQRGYLLGLLVGKIIPVGKSNPNSGLRFSLNFGALEHKVQINDGGAVPQLAGAYRKGYDRLTNGYELTQFIGYQHLSDNQRINFFAGFEFTQAFTKNRRTINYDTMETETEPRLDLLHGIRIGWILPIYSAGSIEKVF